MYKRTACITRLAVHAVFCSFWVCLPPLANFFEEQSELDYLIYNALFEYAALILNGDPETYLKTVTEYKSLDS